MRIAEVDLQPLRPAERRDPAIARHCAQPSMPKALL
jgi:hypothetical protein